MLMGATEKLYIGSVRDIAAIFFIIGCLDFDECVEGSHHCDENADCINAIGSYICTCRDGFTGNGRNCHISPLVGVVGIGLPPVVVMLCAIALAIIVLVMRRRHRAAKVEYEKYFFPWNKPMDPDFDIVDPDRRISYDPSIVSIFNGLFKPERPGESNSHKSIDIDQPLHDTEQANMGAQQMTVSAVYHTIEEAASGSTVTGDSGMASSVSTSDTEQQMFSTCTIRSPGGYVQEPSVYNNTEPSESNENRHNGARGSVPSSVCDHKGGRDSSTFPDAESNSSSSILWPTFNADTKRSTSSDCSIKQFGDAQSVLVTPPSQVIEVPKVHPMQPPSSYSLSPTDFSRNNAISGNTSAEEIKELLSITLEDDHVVDGSERTLSSQSMLPQIEGGYVTNSNLISTPNMASVSKENGEAEFDITSQCHIDDLGGTPCSTTYLDTALFDDNHVYTQQGTGSFGCDDSYVTLPLLTMARSHAEDTNPCSTLTSEDSNAAGAISSLMNRSSTDVEEHDFTVLQPASTTTP